MNSLLTVIFNNSSSLPPDHVIICVCVCVYVFVCGLAYGFVCLYITEIHHTVERPNDTIFTIERVDGRTRKY